MLRELGKPKSMSQSPEAVTFLNTNTHTHTQREKEIFAQSVRVRERGRDTHTQRGNKSHHQQLHQSMFISIWICINIVLSFIVFSVTSKALLEYQEEGQVFAAVSDGNCGEHMGLGLRQQHRCPGLRDTADQVCVRQQTGTTNTDSHLKKKKTLQLCLLVVV